ncbi:MAG: hypothetical protein AAF959_07620 [Cyanobacteria bacterium P01_D01_bin.56]
MPVGAKATGAGSLSIGGQIALGAAAFGGGLYIGNAIYEGIGRPFGPSLGDYIRRSNSEQISTQREALGESGDLSIPIGQESGVQYRVLTQTQLEINGTPSGGILSLDRTGPGPVTLNVISADTETRSGDLLQVIFGNGFTYDIGGGSTNKPDTARTSLLQFDVINLSTGETEEIEFEVPPVTPPDIEIPEAPADAEIPETATELEELFAPLESVSTNADFLAGVPLVPGLAQSTLPLKKGVNQLPQSPPSGSEPPKTTKKKPGCGCNSGVISGVGDLLDQKLGTTSDAGQLAAINAKLTKIDLTTTATGGGVAANAGVLSQVFATVTNVQKFSRQTWDFLQIDRILAVANFTFNLHNAYFISRNLVETLGWTVDSVLSILGFQLKDADDEPIQLTEILGDWINGAIDAVVPDETQTQISQTLEKANRIYQAATNIYYSMWSLFDSSQAIAEITGQYVGKIGNALKKSGAVLENSYGWMSERFDRIYTTNRKWEQLINAADAAEVTISEVGFVASEVTQIGETFNELNRQRDDLKNLLRDEDRGGGLESTTVTSEENDSKLDSEAPVNMSDPSFDAQTAGRPEDDGN